MYKLISAVFMAVSFSMAVPAAVVAQEIGTRQVYEAAQAGRMAEAQQMMDKVLRDHPNSAKAHYVEAELMAKQGRYAEAKAELDTAQRLAPGLPFAKPQSVQELTNLVNSTRSSSSSTTRASEQYVRPQNVASQSAGFPWGFLVVLVLAGGAIFLVIRAIRARSAARTAGMAGGYPANYAQRGGGAQPGAQPQYGPGPMPGAPGAPGAPAGGGMGAGILGGLATGAAMGVGAVAAQQLMHHFTDQDRPASGFNPPQQDPDIVPFDDMGGQDFGIADNSSWDDGGSGGGSSGGDSSGGDW